MLIHFRKLLKTLGVQNANDMLQQKYLPKLNDSFFHLKFKTKQVIIKLMTFLI